MTALRPILFSGPMVRAIRTGRKTQTRRVVKPQPPVDVEVFYWEERDLPIAVADEPGCYVESNHGLRWNGRAPCSPGDRLWVREAFGVWRPYVDVDGYVDDFDAHRGKLADAPEGYRTIYRADWEGDDEGMFWRPSIHMPRRLSRLQLEVKDVRIERLRDVSESDAKAEGVEPLPQSGNVQEPPHRAGFRRLWDELNAGRGFGWESDPWVWVVEFAHPLEAGG